MDPSAHPAGTAHDHAEHQAHAGHGGHPMDGVTWGAAAKATLHCLTGCAIGEILGMAIGTALVWGNVETTALAIVLAFVCSGTR